MRLRDIFWILDTKNSRALITKWAEKAGLDDADELIEYVESEFKDTNDQLAAAYWICKDIKVKPSTIKQALYICKQKKLDPLKQNPDELIEKNPDIKPKEKAINPDTVLSDRQEDGEGNVTYAARDEDREVLRQIINTHYGIDANPWCLLQAENGKLTDDSERMWKHYNAYPKRVAFRDGKLLAFSAGTNKDMREWWDRFDRSFPFIPYDGKSWIGREGGTFEIRKGNVFKTRGNSTSKLNTEYSTDIEESITDITIDTKRHIITDRFGTYPYEEKDGMYVVTNGRHDYDHRAVTFTLNKDLELDGEYIERDLNNGSIIKKTTYTNGIKNGPFESYYENGKLRMKCTYKDDALNGPHESYYENGQLYERGTYKDYKLNGPHESYYEDGKLRERCTYKDYKLNGPHESYYENGQLYERGTYKDDRRDGPYESYYENGQLYERGTYKDDRRDGPYESYYENGQLRMKCTYKDGYKNGPFESYYDNGQLQKKCVYKHGAYDGPYESYYKDGQLEKRRGFKDDMLDGLSESYYENGQLSERGTYKDDELNGPYESYYEDGKLRERCTYKDGYKKVE